MPSKKCRRVLDTEIPGGRKQGRPKRKLSDNIRDDLRTEEVMREDAQGRARSKEMEGVSAGSSYLTQLRDASTSTSILHTTY